MEIVKTIWVFTLLTILVGFICWSITVLTFRTQSIMNMIKAREEKGSYTLQDMPWYKIYSEEYSKPREE